MMTRFLLIALFVTVASCRADIASEPWPSKVRDVPPIPASITVGDFKIGIHEPRDPEARTLGGSGGGMYEVTVRNTRSGAKRTFIAQGVGAAILRPYRGWPQIEIWSRAGGGSWCRSLYRPTGNTYDQIRTDDFTEFDFNATDKAKTTTMPGGDDLLYYVETRLPEPRK